MKARKMTEYIPNSIKKVYSPSAGGLRRLTERLHLYEIQQQQDVQIWRGIAACLILTMSTLFIDDLHQKPLPEVFTELPNPGEVHVLDRQANRVPGTPENVHFYWLFQNDSK